MIPALRQAFNRDFRPETYRRFLLNLEAAAGTPIAIGKHVIQTDADRHRRQ